MNTFVAKSKLVSIPLLSAATDLMEDEGQVTGDIEFTEKPHNKAKLASPVHVAESHTAWPSQASQELFQGE